MKSFQALKKLKQRLSKRLKSKMEKFIGYEKEDDIIYELYEIIDKREVSVENIKEKYNALIEEKKAIEEEIAPKEDRLNEIEEQLVKFEIFKTKEEPSMPTKEEAEEVLE